MIVAEVLCKHLLYGGSVIVSVDYDKLEGCSHNIDDIVDEPSCFVAFHAMYVSSDTDFPTAAFRNYYSVHLTLC